MKHNKLFLAVIAVGILALAGCKKENELPPRPAGYVLDYVIPAPTFLTQEERAVLDAKREEWDNL